VHGFDPSPLHQPSCVTGIIGGIESRERSEETTSGYVRLLPQALFYWAGGSSGFAWRSHLPRCWLT
jgi:hypothetical protein